MKKMTPMAKAAAVAILCAGVAFLGLRAGGRQQTAAADAQRDPLKGYYAVSMPRYPGATEYPLTRSLAVGKAPMKMSYFVTKDDPLKVCRFYADRWKTAGYHVKEDVTLVGGSVSAVDVKNGVVRQVLVTEQGSGRFLVFPSVTRQPFSTQTPLADKLGKGEKPPVFPGAEAVHTFKAKDPLARSRITRFVDFGGMETNVEFYRTEMAARGWRLAQDADKFPGLEEGHHLLVFKKGTREVTINFAQVGKSKQVRVHITEISGRR